MNEGCEANSIPGAGEKNTTAVVISVMLIGLVIFGLYFLYTMPSARLISLMQQGFGAIHPLLNVFGWLFGIVMILMALSPSSSSSVSSSEFCDGGIENSDYYDSYTYY